MPRRISLKAQRPDTIRNIPNCKLCETGCEDPKCVEGKAQEGSRLKKGCLGDWEGHVVGRA